ACRGRTGRISGPLAIAACERAATVPCSRRLTRSARRDRDLDAVLAERALTAGALGREAQGRARARVGRRGGPFQAVARGVGAGGRREGRAARERRIDDGYGRGGVGVG